MIGLIIAAFVVAGAAGYIIYIKKNTNMQQTVQIAPVRRNNNVLRSAPIAERSETGPMIYYANDKHDSNDKEYRFNYKKVNGTYRAYILKMPNLRGRDGKSIPTHRLWDENNNPYICWKGRVTSLKDIQNISRVWADNIQEYIATGKRFGPE